MKVAELWRHPIKSHGRERLEQVSLSEGKTMPFDRTWAVAHDAAKIDWDTPEPVWAQCANFSRGSKAPSLMAINATLDETTNQITLSHPDLSTVTINPDVEEDAAKLIEWVKPICPPDRALPKRLYKVPGRGMTDSDFPSVSINSFSSLKALSEQAGIDVSPLRFRGNIWIEGAKPWAELDWMDQEIQIGSATLKVVERTERCRATTSNPDTGKIDLDVLNVLKDNWGHLDFGVRAIVLKGGDVKIGDMISL